LKTLLAVVFLVATAAAQTPPEKEAMRRAEVRKIDQERERLRQSAARSAPIIIGFPTLTPVQPIIVIAATESGSLCVRMKS
jgi:hypothetical protein